MICEHRKIRLRLFLRATSITRVQYSLFFAERKEKESVLGVEREKWGKNRKGEFFVFLSLFLVDLSTLEQKKNAQNFPSLFLPGVLVDLFRGVQELDLVSDRFHARCLPDLDLVFFV